MAWQGFHSLKQQDITSLRLVNSLVEALLAHEPILPPELRAKLDSYHADLANAIEAKGGSGKAACDVPETSAEEARSDSDEEGRLLMTRPRNRESPDSPLRQLRKRRGMSQQALADQAGMSQSALSMIEKGERKLSRIDHLIALASALRVDPSELAGAAMAGLQVPPEYRLGPGFPAIRDDITVTRHFRLAEELREYTSRGAGGAAGIWLRRIARDSSVDPWLLLDQFTSLEAVKRHHSSARRLTLAGE